MNVFFISDLKIFSKGGGSLDEQKRYSGVEKWCKNVGANLFSFSLDNKIDTSFQHCELKKTKIADILSRFFFHSSFVFFNTKVIKKMIKEYKPKAIVMCRTRFGFFCKRIKKHFPNIKICVIEANVEYDYANACFLNENQLKRKLELFCVKRDEKNCLKNIDGMINLTKRDESRFHELYNGSYKETILPVCIKKEKTLKINNGKNNVVFIGSLNYAPNVNAINSFIDKIWIPFFKDNETFNLIVGGKNPHESIVQRLNTISNSELHKNFNSVEDIIPSRSLFVSPIQEGAGMKVKVAEALSMGVGIIGSSETFIGYEEVLNDCDSSFLIKEENDLQKYRNFIDEYFRNFSQNNSVLLKKLFLRYYSFDRSTNVIGDFLGSLINEKI